MSSIHENKTINTEIIHLEPRNCTEFLKQEPATSTNLDQVLHFNSDVLNGLNFEETLNNSVLTFIVKLYNETSLTRKQTQFIIENVEQLISKPLEILHNKSLTLVNHNDNMINKNDINISNLSRNFDALKNMFKNFKTEYLRLRLLKNLNCFFEPAEYLMGERMEQKNNGMIVKRKCCLQFMSLRVILKKFLELPDIFTTILMYMKSLSTEHVMSNLIQGKLWQKKLQSLEHKTVLPLILYYDDFEVGNPLGSHAGINKLGAVYIRIACIPPEYSSELENIHLVSLFYSSDLKQFGTKKIFEKILFELNMLANEGLEIEVNNEKQRVYFLLALIVGDNLGLHSILGFTESFSASFPCRFCYIPKKLQESETTLISNLIRTKISYERDVKIIQNVTQTGIREECVFNNVLAFHVTENFSADIMHDLFEGVCNWEMALILNYLIYVDKIFTLECLNKHIEFFNFGSEFSRPPLIMPEHIKKKHLKMSASEMFCFMKHAGVIFGYLVPTENKYWSLYIILHEIITIVTSTTVQKEIHILLSDLITNHHQLYLQLFQLPLRPKHHHMIHYSKVIEQIGPLINIWSMRFESKHRELKMSSNVIASRVNIPHSLAVKQQLKYSTRIFLKRGFSKNFSFKENKNLNISKYLLRNKINLPVRFKNSVAVNNSKIYGTVYKKGQVLMVKVNELPLFGTVNVILINSNEDILFICKLMHTVCFNNHVCGYEVQNSDQHCLVSYDELFDIKPWLISHVPNIGRIVTKT